MILNIVAVQVNQHLGGRGVMWAGMARYVELFYLF